MKISIEILPQTLSTMLTISVKADPLHLMISETAKLELQQQLRAAIQAKPEKEIKK